MSLAARFFDRFFGDFMKTVREDKMSYAAIPATLLWFIINATKIHLDIWTVIGPLIFGASFVICQHAWSAARAVILDIDSEGTEERHSIVLDSSGKQNTVLIDRPKPHSYALKLYGVLGTIIVLCLLACFWSVDRYREAVLSEDETAKPGHLRLAWGDPEAPGFYCTVKIDGSLILKLKDKYDVALLCGLVDSGVDKYRDTHISVGSARTIQNGEMEIVIPVSKSMHNAGNEMLGSTLKDQSPESKAVIGEWFEVVLVPVGTNMETIHTLSEVKLRGGRVLSEEGYY
jgi:hypothetical protein